MWRIYKRWGNIVGECMEKLSIKNLLFSIPVCLMLGMIVGMTIGHCASQSSGIIMMKKSGVLEIIFYLLIIIIVSEIILFFKYREAGKILFLIKCLLIGIIIGIVLFGGEMLCIL